MTSRLRYSTGVPLSIILLLGLGACAPEPAPEEPEEKLMFENRSAWRIENNRLRVTVLEGGGHLAEVVLKTESGDSLNPLWIPPWPSIDPWTYDREKHGDMYGTDSEAALLSGIMGHNLCFDYWGAPSKTEFEAGMAYHGEVSWTPGEKISQDESSLVHKLDLKDSGTAITRTMRLADGQSVLYVEETASNKLGLDRAFGWVQHATFGPPFLDPEHTFFDASATKGDLGEAEDYKPLPDWPVGSPDQREQDYRRFAPEPPSRKMAYFLLDDSREVEFITAINTEHRLLMAYVFLRKDYPWMMVWEENRHIQLPPWNGKAMTRGMEFGNTRIPGTAQAYFAKPEMYGTRTFGWLDAKGELTARYLVVMATVPEGFDAVSDVRLDGSEIEIAGVGDLAPIRVPFNPEWFPID